MSEEAVAQAWVRIEAWMQKNAPAVFATLKPGATDTELEALQVALGVTLPTDMAASYRIHNGAGDDLSVSFGGWYDFFDLDRILDEWTVWKELLDGGEFEGEASEPKDSGIRPDWWNAAWIPITGDGGGNHLCVDLAPAGGGTVGQIITMWHDDTDRELIAPSFTALLQKWADDLEAGKYVSSRKYGLVSREEFDSEGYADEEQVDG